MCSPLHSQPRDGRRGYVKSTTAPREEGCTTLKIHETSKTADGGEELPLRLKERTRQGIVKIVFLLKTKSDLLLSI